jgi:hypothetical protein
MKFIGSEILYDADVKVIPLPPLQGWISLSTFGTTLPALHAPYFADTVTTIAIPQAVHTDLIAISTLMRITYAPVGVYCNIHLNGLNIESRITGLPSDHIDWSGFPMDFRSGYGNAQITEIKLFGGTAWENWGADITNVEFYVP